MVHDFSCGEASRFSLCKVDTVSSVSSVTSLLWAPTYSLRRKRSNEKENKYLLSAPDVRQYGARKSNIMLCIYVTCAGT